MLSPGFYSLGNFSITTAGMQIGEAVENLEGLLALCVQFRFIYGSGGSSVKAYLQTSLDQGNTWLDLASFVPGSANETKVLNFSSLTPKTTQADPTDGALADDTAVDGILGDRLRVKVISTGTYSGQTTLSVGAVVR